MKKFITKFSIFIIPVILIHLFTYLFYSTKQGDLLRVDYIMNGFPIYKMISDPQISAQKNFTKISELKKGQQFNILTIGDSFSELDSQGYQNYLGRHKEIHILHIDQQVHGNDPLQALTGLVNGDFFEKYPVQFVVFQSVERYFTGRGQSVNPNRIINHTDIDSLVACSRNNGKEEANYRFFSDRILKFSLYNLLYLFNDRAYFSEVYQTKLSRSLFSGNRKKLLFVYDDIDGVLLNNELKNVQNLNTVLNMIAEKLKQKKIRLIVLPAPDKYDFYYEYIVKKSKYLKPLFFEHLSKMQKKYGYVDAKKILSGFVSSQNDIYYYGDTHWSPFSSKVIADSLYQMIRTDSLH